MCRQHKWNLVQRQTFFSLKGQLILFNNSIWSIFFLFRFSLRVSAWGCLSLKNARTTEKCYVGQLKGRWLKRFFQSETDVALGGKGMGWYLTGVRYGSPFCTVLVRIWRQPEQGECWCEDGWGKLPGSSKCSQQSTQASCPEGQIVREAGRSFQILSPRNHLNKMKRSLNNKINMKLVLLNHQVFFWPKGRYFKPAFFIAGFSSFGT